MFTIILHYYKLMKQFGEIIVDVNISAHVEGLKWPFHMLEIACQSVSRPSSQSL